MKNRYSIALAAGFSLVLCAIPVLAHHSFAAQYDRSKPTTITGPVSRIEWINPHARFFMNVKDGNNKIVNWEVELGSLAGLLRRNWSRSSLKIGDVVTVNGYLAKDGSSLANASTVTLSDGRRVLAGSSAETGANP